MIDSLFTKSRWEQFCGQVREKLGDEVAPEDIIDLARELTPDELFDIEVLRDWAEDHDYVEGW